MRLGAHYLGQEQCSFTVWAPKADSVAVEMTSPIDRVIPMESQPDGYWHITAADVQPGTCYLYQLNGGETHPDPASQFQPDGVHTASQVIDHHFDWTDQQWSGVRLEDLVIYELHVGTFTPEGTFAAIVPRLEELRSLGVTAIELMPIAQFPGSEPPAGGCAYRNWGYDGVYPFAVQNSYGGPAALKQLVNACHQAGIAVVLDVVYNHFGPEGNYLNHFGPYFTSTYRTPWGDAVNFDDAHSPDVRNFFIQNALYWLRDYHIDVLRLDAVHAIYDLGAKHFLEELVENVANLSQEQGRKFYLIAESDLNDPRIIRPIEHCGYGMDAQWSDDFHHALYTLLTGDQIGYYADFGRCEQLAKVMRESFVYDWKYSPHRQRFHGRSAVDRPPHQFVVCIQNHDQIGNQVLGERLSKLVSFEALKLAAGAVLLSPQMPLLFMGEEYGEEVPFMYFVSHSDPDLIHAVREGRKREFEAFHCKGEPPDPEGMETFLKCKLNWNDRHTGKHGTLWSWYQFLLQLRRSHPALSPEVNETCPESVRDRMETGSGEADKIVWWHRWRNADHLLCLMNFGAKETTLPCPIASGNWRKLGDSAAEKWGGAGSLTPDQLAQSDSVTLRSHSFVLYEQF